MSDETYVVQYLADDGSERFTYMQESYDRASKRAAAMQESGYNVVAVVTREYAVAHRKVITSEDLVGPEAAAEMRRTTARLSEMVGHLVVEASEEGSAMNDRSHDAGEALSGVRTVLSRAETALDALGPTGTKLEWPSKDEHPDDRRENRFEDPDAEDMRVALEEVIQILGRWRKMGRTVRSTCR